MLALFPFPCLLILALLGPPLQFFLLARPLLISYIYSLKILPVSLFLFHLFIFPNNHTDGRLSFETK